MESTQKNPRESVEQGIINVQQNKVNAKNAFEFDLIERMDDVLEEIRNDEDFHFAATTIESSAKIYGFRVDNVHAETFKVRNLFDTYDDTAEGAGDDKKARRVRQVPVAQMKAAHCKTATELNIPDFDAMDKVENVDPFFAQMTHKTEKGGDQGLLLNLMPSTHRAGVIFNGQVPMHVDGSALDGELDSLQMKSDSRVAKQVTALFKEVTSANTVMDPGHYEYLRDCAREGAFGAEQTPRSPATSPGRRSPIKNEPAESHMDSALPDVAPLVSPADLANIEMELAVEDEPYDAGFVNDQALLDQSEEELAAKELESMAIVEEKVVKKRAPKNLKKDRKPRTREERKNMRKEFFAAIDAEGEVDGDGKLFKKTFSGLPPEVGETDASKLLAEALAVELEHHDFLEPEPPLAPAGDDISDNVSHYKKLIEAIYKEKNPAKLGELDTLFEKFGDTEDKLKKMYDAVCKKYEVVDAPALLEAPAVDPFSPADDHFSPAPDADYAVPEPASPSAVPKPAAPEAQETANHPSLQASWLKAKRSTIRVPHVVNALEASVNTHSKHEDIKFSTMMEEARGHLHPNEKNQLTIGIAFISLLHLANDQNLELIQGDDCGDFAVNLEKKGTDHHKEQFSKVMMTSKKAKQSPGLPMPVEIPTATPSSKKAKTDIPKSAKTAGKTSEAPAPSSKKMKVDQPTMTPDNPPPQKKAFTPEKKYAVSEKPASRKK
jgi:chromatin segregation and condensation protein Rec8/ScpA/Scc1 (kleisin family)